MAIRRDECEPDAVTTGLAGYINLFLAGGCALMRDWDGALGFGVASGAMLFVGTGRVYQPAVTRGPDGITCRYNPWREGSVYVHLVAVCGLMIYPLGQPAGWLRSMAIVGLATAGVGVVRQVREWRRGRLRITPTSLTLAVPALRYALTEIPRERIVSITGETRTRRTGGAGPVTQIAYLTSDSSIEEPSRVLIGPTNATNALWVTVDQVELLAGLQAWQEGDPRDPALLGRVECLLRGAAASGLQNGDGELGAGAAR